LLTTYDYVGVGVASDALGSIMGMDVNTAFLRALCRPKDGRSQCPNRGLATVIVIKIF